MAYGVLYEFAFESTNHAACKIQILKKGYSGEVKKRKLGRPPVLKRENKDRIYGTSCEIYAECIEDGEFSQLYTLSPYEFRVEVYRNNQLLWVGFVSPELYSEPDIAPPYDVQIIATDGLGELKDYTWSAVGLSTVQGVLVELLGKSGLERDYYMASNLRFRNEYGSLSAPNQILDIMLNLDHEEGESYYDVLQNLLSAFNFNISTYKDKWILFRETDLLSDSVDGKINLVDQYGYIVETEPGEFGSMRSCEYWPVGQLSINIEPAKNAIELESPNYYKENVLDNFDKWSPFNGASYSETEGAYLLPAQEDWSEDTGVRSGISLAINFGAVISFPLGLRIRARKYGYIHMQEGIGVKVEMFGSFNGVNASTFFLKKRDISSGDPATDYVWTREDVSFTEKLKGQQGEEATTDIQDIDIVIPLRVGRNASVGAERLYFTIFNSGDRDSILVYDVSLVKYEQIKGYKANIKIDNNAREEHSDINLSLTSGDRVPKNGELFMTGIPIQPSGNGPITLWHTQSGDDENYLSFMAQDWGRSIGLPKMRYSGVLNIPGNRYDLPVLFSRDNTYYFPKTYSFDLYNDELNIEMVSVSAADVSIDSVVISQISQASGQMGGTSTGGGATGGGSVSVSLDKEMSDTSGNAVENRVIKSYVDTVLASALSGYLPLSGGTISGNIVISKSEGSSSIQLGSLGNMYYDPSSQEIGIQITDASYSTLKIRSGASNPIFRHNYEDYDVIHSGNIGSQSVSYAANAGLLQGHSLISGTNVYGCIPTVGSDGVMEVGKYLDFHNDSNADSDYDLRLMIEGKYGNTVMLPHSNGTLALTTDNVASATKLATPRTIWGQSFDGTGNVDGKIYQDGKWVFGLHADNNLYIGYDTKSVGNSLIFGKEIQTYNSVGNVTSIIKDNGNILIGTTSDNGAKLQVAGTALLLNTMFEFTDEINRYGGDMYLQYRGNMAGSQGDARTGNIRMCYNGGKVTIGTIGAQATLTVAGDAIITGDLASGSDIRFKNIVENTSLDINDIANAPLFTFKWNDRDDFKTHLGTSAQYWESIAPELVTGEEFKTLNYASLGVAMGISLAQRILNHEERIKVLEKRISELETEK